MRYMNVAATHAAEVYVETERLEHARGEQVRRDLLEDLLDGQGPQPEPKLDAARAAGLEFDGNCLMLLARALSGGDETVMRAGFCESFLKHGVRLALAVSTEQATLGDVPVAYREVCEAIEWLGLHRPAHPDVAAAAALSTSLRSSTSIACTVGIAARAGDTRS